MERTSSQNWFWPEWPCSLIRAAQFSRSGCKKRGNLESCGGKNVRTRLVLSIKAWFTLATETEAETETKARNSIQALLNGDGMEENGKVCLLLFRLRFTGFVWDFVLPSPSLV